jgi:hypothetical protein
VHRPVGWFAPVNVEPISADESRELLATREVGRLAVVVGGYPEIFPVNYAVVRDRVVIRTDPGRQAVACAVRASLLRGRRAGRAWQNRPERAREGVVQELKAGDRHAEELDLATARIRPWAGGPKSHVLVVTPVNVTGRRIARS